jgi:hypothetical protein
MSNGNTVRVTISTTSLELIEETREVNELPGEYVERAIRTEAYIRATNRSVAEVKLLLDAMSDVPGTVTTVEATITDEHLEHISSAIDGVSEDVPHQCPICGATSGDTACIANGQAHSACPYWERVPHERAVRPTPEAMTRAWKQISDNERKSLALDPFDIEDLCDEDD